MLDYMKKYLIDIESQQQDISNEMESLDPNSKDYIELDFEYNWLAGQIIATRHFIQVGEQHASN